MNTPRVAASAVGPSGAVAQSAAHAPHAPGCARTKTDVALNSAAHNDVSIDHAHGGTTVSLGIFKRQKDTSEARGTLTNDETRTRTFILYRCAQKATLEPTPTQDRIA